VTRSPFPPANPDSIGGRSTEVPGEFDCEMDAGQLERRGHFLDRLLRLCNGREFFGLFARDQGAQAGAAWFAEPEDPGRPNRCDDELDWFVVDQASLISCVDHQPGTKVLEMIARSSKQRLRRGGERWNRTPRPA